MGSHELIDHTADVLIDARAPDLSGLFAEAAAALFEVICDPALLGNSYTATVRAEADAVEDLMHDWLGELLFLHETEDVLLRGFDVRLGERTLEALVTGEKIDRSRHTLRTEVKAVTYHMLEVNREEPSVTVLFDI